MSKLTIWNKIWKVAPLFIGGPTNDTEVRAIMNLAVKMYSKLPGKRYYNVTTGELVAIACQKYFNS